MCFKQGFKGERKKVTWQNWSKDSKQGSSLLVKVFVFIDKLKLLEAIALWHQLWWWFYRSILIYRIIKLYTLILYGFLCLIK